MDSANVALSVVILSATLWWIAHSSLITVQTQQRDSFCKERLEAFIRNSLSLITHGLVTPETLVLRLRENDLQLAQVPDTVTIIRISGAYIAASFMSALIFSLIPFGIEGGIAIGNFPQEARSTSQLASLTASSLSGLALFWTIMLCNRFGAWEGIRELAQWGRIRSRK